MLEQSGYLVQIMKRGFHARRYEFLLMNFLLFRLPGAWLELELSVLVGRQKRALMMWLLALDRPM